MAYVATRGGERAIEQAERLFRAELGAFDAQRVQNIRKSMPYLIDRVMGEASLHDRDLAALALAQTGGELSEAILLLRAWRTTQPRIAIAESITQSEIITYRRISAAFKDIPGGQILGPTLDYAHRILATEVLDGATLTPAAVDLAATAAPATQPSLADWERSQGFLAPIDAAPLAKDQIPDITREPLLIPAPRAHRLQSLARAETGGVLALGYSAMRGYGNAHPTVNELRIGEANVRVTHPDGTIFTAARVRVSQAEVTSKEKNGFIDLGFAATFGWNEVKVIAAATLDLNSRDAAPGSAVEEEFYLYHTEAVESSGFCIHFKLPHYVTFQSLIDALRGAKTAQAQGDLTDDPSAGDAL